MNGSNGVSVGSRKSDSGWQSRHHAAEVQRADPALRWIRVAIQDAAPVLLAFLLIYVVFFQK